MNVQTNIKAQTANPAVNMTMAAAEPKKPVEQMQTGPYLHDPRNRVFLRFESESETPRSFTVIIATASISNGKIDNRNGIAILDNDNMAVVVDMIYPQASPLSGPSRQQRQCFSLIQELGWNEFSYFCRTRETYRHNIADISVKCAVPYAGNRDNQIRLGALNPAEIDNRNDFIRGIHASPNHPHSFPRANRAAMITEILSHDVMEDDASGRSYLAWDLGLKFKWNATGRLPGGADEVCPSMDARWSTYLNRRPQVVTGALHDFLAPYVDQPFSPFEMSDDVTAALDIAGQNARQVVMRSFADKDLGFASLSDLNNTVSKFSDEEVLNLWVAVRTLDIDFGQKELSAEMAQRIHEMRVEIESGWLNEEVEALDFN